MVAFVCAKSPMQLVREGACYWPAEAKNKETQEVVLKKGCPRYYTENGKGCSVKFSTKKIKEDDEIQEILIADWTVTEATKDGKNKFKGLTKFIVESRDGEEGLFPYETTVDCKGGVMQCLDLHFARTVYFADVFEFHKRFHFRTCLHRVFSLARKGSFYFRIQLYTIYGMISSAFSRPIC